MTASSAPLTPPTTDSPSSATREDAETILRALVGRDDATLRDDQWEAVRALVHDRRRALVVQRTGWGKSAVYFVATALLRAQGAGPTLLVSPLLALMRNQVQAAERAGIRARTVNSSNLEEWVEVEQALTEDAVDVLLVSPERLNNPDFRDRVLPAIAARTGLLVVDEAHCISDWGHDFRPDYRRIRDALTRLRPGIPVLATTATANERVVRDVAEQLEAGGVHDVLVQRGTLERESLRLGVLELPGADARIAWLVEHLGDLTGSGIIYALTVSAAEDVAGILREAGHTVLAYSGRTDTAERLRAEQALAANEVKALVATSALGMGFDKPDLGFVIHLGAPPSPIAYYQQVGRAGRGVASADVLLLPGAEDAAIWAWFADVGFPAESVVRRTLSVLSEAGKPMSTAALETQVDLRRNRLETMLKVLDVDGAVRRVRGGWEATGAEWAYDTDRYARVAEAREREQQAMRDYVATESCRMLFLRSQLDDPEARACGRCDRCAGPWAPATVSDATRERAHEALSRPGVEVEARTLWPTGMRARGVQLSGKIAESERSESGRALARLSDLGWGPRLRDLLAGPDTDELSPELVTAAVSVLKTWGWEHRPTSVVAMPSRRNPQLIEAFARRISDIGRLTAAGTLAYVDGGPTGTRGGNSAFRLAAVWQRLVVPDEVADRVRAAGGPVLLVDDLADSRWTLTVAAQSLRQAGAPAVLPFVLALDA